MNSFFGKAEIVPFHFKNTTNLKLIYQAVIDDPDSRHLNSPEFTLVHNPGEWKFWCHFNNLPEPSAYEMLKYEETATKKIHYF